MRTVISFITEDYFDYVGTSPVYSPLRRVELSIPCEFSSFISMKYKQVVGKSSFNRCYFVILVVDVEQKTIDKVIETAKINMIQRYDFKHRTLKS